MRVKQREGEVSATPCTVTGNLELLTGGAITLGSVRFELVNFGLGTPPGVMGVTVFPWNFYTVTSDATGFFTLKLWGNDVINPANTLYQVTYYDQAGDSLGNVLYSIVGPSFNMNTATPVFGAIPPVLTSTGYASGAAVTAGNFTLSPSWGAGATITNVVGVQQRCSITVTAGAGPAISPTVTFIYPGAYPLSSLSMAQMTGGTGVLADVGVTTSTTQAIYTLEDLPQATRTYIFVFDTVGN